MHFKTNALPGRCAVTLVLCMLAAPSFPASERTPAPRTSLTPPTVKHNAECPAPKRELCVIKRPVGTGYRLLTSGINLEDSGDYWIADFTKSKLADRATTTFRVIGKDNDVHEIAISFHASAMPKAKQPTSKKTADVTTADKEKSAVQPRDVEKKPRE